MYSETPCISVFLRQWSREKINGFKGQINAIILLLKTNNAKIQTLHMEKQKSVHLSRLNFCTNFGSGHKILKKFFSS